MPRGSVYATEATTELCDIMLRDSAHIQMFEAEWHNRKAKRAGKEEYVPLYELKDAVGVMEHFVPCPYGRVINICDGIKVRFVDVGHLLGSASIEVWLEEGDLKRKIAFSGDIGNYNQPIIRRCLRRIDTPPETVCIQIWYQTGMVDMRMGKKNIVDIRRRNRKFRVFIDIRPLLHPTV